MSRKSPSSSLSCSGCGRTFPLAERFCPDCGIPLVFAGHEKINAEYARGELVRVAGGRNQVEAELIQNLLLEEGIPSVVRRSAGFDVPDFLAAGPRDVLVAQSGARAAHEMLLDTELAPTQSVRRPASSLRTVAVAVAVVAAAMALVYALWLAVPQ